MKSRVFDVKPGMNTKSSSNIPFSFFLLFLKLVRGRPIKGIDGSGGEGGTDGGMLGEIEGLTEGLMLLLIDGEILLLTEGKIDL